MSGMNRLEGVQQSPMSQQDPRPDPAADDRELEPGWYRHPAFATGHGYWDGVAFVSGPT